MSGFTFGFIGLGLIGGSIAKALRAVYPDCTIYVNTRSHTTSDAATGDHTADKAISLDDEAWSECDYLFLCAPVENNNALLSDIAPFIGEKTIITDVGSVKSPILAEVIKLGLESTFLDS